MPCSMYISDACTPMMRGRRCDPPPPLSPPLSPPAPPVPPVAPEARHRAVRAAPALDAHDDRPPPHAGGKENGIVAGGQDFLLDEWEGGHKQFSDFF